MGITLGLATGFGILVGSAGVVTPGPGDGELGVEVPVLDPPSSGFQRPEVGCEPSGCVRWSVEVGHGATWAFTHGVYHMTRDALLAVDARDGSIRWRASVPRPGARLLDPTRGLNEVDDELLLASDSEALHAWDTATGEFRWEVAWPATSHVVDADRVDDQLLLATSGALPTFGGDDEPGPGRATGAVVALHPASGVPLWTVEVDRVVRLSPHVLALRHGDLVALDPATGAARWSHPALAASSNQVGDEVVAASADGVAILDTGSGIVRDRLPIDLEAVFDQLPPDQPWFGPGAGLRMEVHDRLLSVGTPRRDEAHQPVRYEWDLALYDLADHRELRRYGRAVMWWPHDEGLLVVLAASHDGLYLDGLSTTDVDEVWRRGLQSSEASGAWSDGGAGDELLIPVAVTQDDVEIVSVDPRTGQELDRYGGVGWEAIGDGILASGSSQPVVGSSKVSTLAGPQGSVAFTRQVTIVSTEPMIVAYWDTLIRVDDRLLSRHPPAQRGQHHDGDDVPGCAGPATRSVCYRPVVDGR